MKVKAIEMERPEIARIIEAAGATGMRLDEVASLRRHEAENALKSGTH